MGSDIHRFSSFVGEELGDGSVDWKAWAGYGVVVALSLLSGGRATGWGLGRGGLSVVKMRI